jgi:hypothetical protein
VGEPGPILNEYFRRTAESLLAKYRQTSVAGASANLGSAREILLRGFLGQVVPPHLKVESGEIWDSVGGETGQIDVVLSRSDVPRLPIGDPNGISAFIAEGVYAAIEVKSNLSTEEFEGSLGKLRRVASLKVLPSVVLSAGPPPLDRPIRAVFGFEGATFATLAHVLEAPGNLGIADLICVLNRGTWVRMGLAKLTGFLIAPDATDDLYAPFDGKALGLAMFYYCLTLGATAFVGRNLPLGSYFNPLTSWKD